MLELRVAITSAPPFFQGFLGQGHEDGEKPKSTGKASYFNVMSHVLIKRIFN